MEDSYANELSFGLLDSAVSLKAELFLGCQGGCKGFLDVKKATEVKTSSLSVLLGGG